MRGVFLKLVMIFRLINKIYPSVDDRVRKILQEHFDYSVAPEYEEIFQGIVKQGMQDLIDKYSIAIYFMLVMMDALDNDGSKEVTSFLTVNKYKIYTLLDKTDDPHANLELTNEVLRKKGVEEIELPLL